MSDRELAAESERQRNLITNLAAKPNRSPREKAQVLETRNRLMELTGEHLRRSGEAIADVAQWGKVSFHQERIVLQAIAKFSAFAKSCLFIVTGTSLVLSAY